MGSSTQPTYVHDIIYKEFTPVLYSSLLKIGKEAEES